MSGLVLHLAREHAAKIGGAAKARFPNECCGLLEGMRARDQWRVVAVHETPNIADDASREFLVDPQCQIDLLRRLRGTAYTVIGCFHSHPMGRAEPSTTDLERAADDDFVWLIAGGGPDQFALGAFVFSSGAFQRLTLEWTG